MTHGMEYLLHWISALMAIAVVGCAIFLIPLAGRSKGWLLVPVSFIMLAAQGMLEMLAHSDILLAGEHNAAVGDTLYIAAMVCMLGGVICLRRFFIERRQSSLQVAQQMKELQRFHQVGIGRELRMKELQEQNRKLQEQIKPTSPNQPLTHSAPDNLGQIDDSTSATDDAAHERTALLFMLEDMERIRQLVEHSQQEWIATVDAIRDPMFLHDAEYRVVRANRAYAELAGKSFKEIIGQPYYQIYPKRDTPFPNCLQALQQGESEEEVAGEHGEIFLSRSFALRDEQGRYSYSVHVLRDVTQHKRMESERKQAELALLRSNRALKTLSTGNGSLIRATSENQLLLAMCNAIVGVGGYRMAWVGYAREDEFRSIEPMVQAGSDESDWLAQRLTWAEGERGNSPGGKAIRSGRTQIVQDCLNNPDCMIWREDAIKHSYASCIALPLREGNRTFGVLTIYDDEPNAFDAAEVDLLEEMAGDLAFGILGLRLKEAHLQHEQRLHDSLLETIHAVAAIVEQRDPYTAGHQRRTAYLAQAIARELGLPEDDCQTIYLAGVVHDIGKVSLPFEILNKPGKLSDIEFSLIRTHAQSGFDILAPIHFPWPIAQIVLQHHERMDGSGYPNRLKDEQILLAARILGVADVVEAMSSHRPYRASLSMQVALEEITLKRDSHFDPRVVDACLNLFNEKRFEFKN